MIYHDTFQDSKDILVSPVCLPWPLQNQTLEVEEQTKGTVLGWGRSTSDKMTATEVICL